METNHAICDKRKKYLYGGTRISRKHGSEL